MLVSLTTLSGEHEFIACTVRTHQFVTADVDGTYIRLIIGVTSPGRELIQFASARDRCTVMKSHIDGLPYCLCKRTMTPVHPDLPHRSLPPTIRYLKRYTYIYHGDMASTEAGR